MANPNLDHGVRGPYLHSVTLDGFKTYGIKAVFDGLNPALNYIAGPSNTGKSSFLDSICLVLGLNIGNLQVDTIKKLLFSHGENTIKKAIVSMGLRSSDLGDAVKVISLEISLSADPSEVYPYKVDGEARTEDEIKEFLQSMHYDATSSLFHISREKINCGLAMPPSYILNLLREACGFASQRNDIKSDIEKQQRYLLDLQDRFEGAYSDKAKLEDWSAKNIELESLHKNYIWFEFLRLSYEKVKAKSELDRIKLALEKLEADKATFDADSRLAEKLHCYTNVRRKHFASGLDKEENLLQCKKNQLRQKQEQVTKVQNECAVLEKLLAVEYKQKIEDFNHLSSFFAGGSSSSSGPPLKKTKVEAVNQPLILELFEQISTEIKKGVAPMTESQDPEQDEQLLSAKKQLLRTCSTEVSKLETEVAVCEERVNMYRVNLGNVDAEIAQQSLERRPDSDMIILNKQIEDLVQKRSNSNAVIGSVSLQIRKLLQDHSWLTEKELPVIASIAEFENAYRKAKQDFEELREKQKQIEPTLFKNVDILLSQLHENETKIHNVIIPRMETELQRLDKEKAPELEERRVAMNACLEQILAFLLPGCVARFEKPEASDSLEIAIHKTKEAGAMTFSEMRKEEQWLLLLSLNLALLHTGNARLCLVDVSDTLFDSNLNFRAKLQELIQNMFQDRQFIVTTLNEEKVVNTKTFKLQAKQTILVSEAL